jgi:hypothetical protein
MSDESSSEMSDDMTAEDGEMEEMAEEEKMSDEDEMMAEEDSMEDEMMDEEMSMETTQFTIRIENTAAADGLTILAPGAYELNDHPVAFFTLGEADRGQGLEALAEDGNPGILVESITQMMGAMAGESTEDEMMEEKMTAFQIGVFNTPVGAEEPGPVGPGGAYEFSVEAYPGQYLTFATMFVQSNDWFFSPGQDGIALFSADGNPISGDITDQIYLWDAGTEVDQIPGEGADQAPRQAGPDTGEAENGFVVLEESFSDFQISVTITTP